LLSEAQPKNVIINPHPKFGHNSKQANLFYKTNKYFHIKTNDAGYHKALMLALAAMCIGIYHRVLAHALQASFQALLNHRANACSCLSKYIHSL
jgi:hypothetical protein